MSLLRPIQEIKLTSICEKSTQSLELKKDQGKLRFDSPETEFLLKLPLRAELIAIHVQGDEIPNRKQQDMIYPMECVLPNSGRHRPLDASQSNEFEQWFEQANTPSKPAFKKKLDETL